MKISQDSHNRFRLKELILDGIIMLNLNKSWVNMHAMVMDLADFSNFSTNF